MDVFREYAKSPYYSFTHIHTDAQRNCPAPYSLISLKLDAESCELLLASLGKYFYQIIGICSVFLKNPVETDIRYSLLEL
jgi:hypothetical protein